MSQSFQFFETVSLYFRPHTLLVCRDKYVKNNGVKMKFIFVTL